MPAYTLLMTTRALLRNSIDPPTVGFRLSCSDGQKYFP